MGLYLYPTETSFLVNGFLHEARNLPLLLSKQTPKGYSPLALSAFVKKEFMSSSQTQLPSIADLE